tara:strand:+ start:3218 stop:6049 length:2832 start_codon:yes stop_codon:yes gene_type:complete
MSDRRNKFLEKLRADIIKAEGTTLDHPDAKKKGYKSSYDVTLGHGMFDPASDKPISEMTLAELKKHQKGMLDNKDNKLNSSAAGAYQFTKSTLFGAKDEKGTFRPGLVQKLKLSMDEKFSPELQDRLVEERLKQSKFFKKLESGKPKAAQDALATIWASLPDSKGKYVYGQPKWSGADEVKEYIGKDVYSEAEQSVIERQKAKKQLKESANPLGDLNPLAPAKGNEMAENIENPDKKFKLVSGPEGKQPGKKFKLVSGPQPQQEEAAEPQEPARPERTMGQSFMQGVGQGFSYGAADEISAISSTVDDVLTTDLGKQVMNDTLAGFTKAQLDGDEMPITRLANQYRKHRDDERALVDEYRGDNPMSYTAGEIAGTFLNYAAVGPLAFGAGMVTRGGKVLYGTLSGMAHNLGSSEEETIGGLAEDTARGGLIGAAGEAAFPVFKGGVKAATDVAERVRSGSLIKFLGGPGTDPRRRLGEVGKQVDDFAERMINYNDADGTPLIKPFMNRQKLSDTLNKNADRIGDKMADILTDMDEAIGKPVIDGYSLRNEVREQVIKPLMTPKSLPEDKAVGAALEDYIIKLTQSLKSVEQSVDPKTGSNVLKEVFEPQTWALSDLAKQKSKLQGMYRKTRLKDADNITVGIAQGKDRIANVMGDFIDKELKGKNIAPEISNQYNAFKQAYGDMAEGSYIVKQQIERDAGKDIFQRIFNDSVVRYTSMASIAGTMVGLPYSKVGMAVAGFKALSESKRVNGIAAKSAESAIKILQKNPEAAATIANRLVTSTALSADDFFDNMTKSLAELTFIDQPLARDPNEVIRRSDKLLHLVEDLDPEMAKNLGAAIDNRDLGSINALMDQLVKAVPAQYVQPGIGFGGKAFSEQDIAKVNSDIQNVRNTRRRKQLHNAFNNQSSDKFRMIPSELYEEKQSDPANFFKFKKKQNKFIKDY